MANDPAMLQALLFSIRDPLPELARVGAILPRDQHLAEGLLIALRNSTPF